MIPPWPLSSQHLLGADPSDPMSSQAPLNAAERAIVSMTAMPWIASSIRTGYAGPPVQASAKASSSARSVSIDGNGTGSGFAAGTLHFELREVAACLSDRPGAEHAQMDNIGGCAHSA